MNSRQFAPTVHVTADPAVEFVIRLAVEMGTAARFVSFDEIIRPEHGFAGQRSGLGKRDVKRGVRGAEWRHADPRLLGDIAEFEANGRRVGPPSAALACRGRQDRGRCRAATPAPTRSRGIAPDRAP